MSINVLEKDNWAVDITSLKLSFWALFNESSTQRLSFYFYLSCGD